MHYKIRKIALIVLSIDLQEIIIHVYHFSTEIIGNNFVLKFKNIHIYVFRKTEQEKSTINSV